MDRPSDFCEGDLVEVQANGSSLKGRVAFREGLQRGVVSSTQLFGQLMVEVEAEPFAGCHVEDRRTENRRRPAGEGGVIAAPDP